ELATAAPDAKEERQTPPAPAVAPAKAPAPEPSTPAPAPAPKAVPKPAPKPVSKPASPSVEKPAPRSPDGARALALLEGRAAPGKEAAGGEKFVIQVAALVSQQKVNELRAKLKSAGIDSFTQNVPTQ